MKIKREIIYGVKSLVYIEKNNGRCVNSSEIAENEKIPKLLLFKILKRFEKRGILKISHGLKGGYSLAKGSNEITMKDIFLAFEISDFRLCIKHPESCTLRKGICPLRKVYIELQKKYLEVLEKIKLKDII